MAMVAVIATSLYTSMRIAFKARTSAEAAVEAPRATQIAMEFIRADIQNAIGLNAALTVSLPGTFVCTDNAGGDDLIFSTTADARDHLDGNGDVKQVELTVLPQGNDQVLVRRVTRIPISLTQIVPDPDDEVLCRRVAVFNLRFFDGTDWQDSWDSTQQDNTLPSAVEVTLQLQPSPDAPDVPGRQFVAVIPIACSTVTASSAGGLGL
jgi:hypothetical protein